MREEELGKKKGRENEGGIIREEKWRENEGGRIMGENKGK